MTSDQKKAREVFARGGFPECFADALDAASQKKAAKSTPLEAFQLLTEQRAKESATDGGIPVSEEGPK